MDKSKLPTYQWLLKRIKQLEQQIIGMNVVIKEQMQELERYKAKYNKLIRFCNGVYRLLPEDYRHQYLKEFEEGK